MGMEGSRWAWGGLYGHEHQHASETQMERSPGLWIWSQMRKEMKMTPPPLECPGAEKMFRALSHSLLLPDLQPQGLTKASLPLLPGIPLFLEQSAQHREAVIGNLLFHTVSATLLGLQS